MRTTSSSCTAAVLLLLAALPGRASAAPALAETFPPGARAYVELRDPAGALDGLLASPAARRLRKHPAAEAFWTSPRGLQLALAEAVLQGATGKSFRSLLRTIGSDEVAVGLYPADGAAEAAPRALVALRADSGSLERVLTSAERFFQRERIQVAEARGARSALWTYGEKMPAFVFHEGSLWVFASDRALATAAHTGPTPSMAADPRLAAARDALPRRGLVLGVLDAAVLPSSLRLAEKPDHPLAALLLGATSEQAARAPWLGVAGELSQADPQIGIALELLVPTPQPASRAAARAYGGTLASLPFAVEGSLATLRLHRNLASFFAQRDALVAKPGIAPLVELAERFGPLSGNLDLVEEFLPGLHADASLVLLQPARRGPAGPGEIRLPDVALLLHMREPRRLGPEATLGFQRLIEAENTGRREPLWVLERAMHAGTPLQIASTPLPAAADADGAPGPAPSFPAEPTQAVAGEYIVLASTAHAARQLLDARGGVTLAPERSNAQLVIDGPGAAALLRANRAALVAQHTAGEAADPDDARSIDFWLELAAFVERATLVQREAKHALAVELELVIGPGRP